MKLQGLAIIFIIIILPISIVLGEYASTQIALLRKEQLYDSRLITATDDALKAFQINTFNDATSDIADSKIESIEASVNAFYNSMKSSFGLEGYSVEELKGYVPALVYTMYDGYYIYSPYKNISEIAPGNPETGEGKELNIILDDSADIEYGLKPYVYYSCRYKMGTDSDFVINYALDNYITIQGIVNNESVYKSGYLVTLAETQSGEGVYLSGTGQFYYNGIEIIAESNLKDYLVEKDSEGNITAREYRYIKLNGTKYYLNKDDDDGDGIVDEYIFYLLGGNRVTQVSKNNNPDLYDEYFELIETNSSGINYYKDAYAFSKWVKDNLENLTLGDAETEIKFSGNETDKIFKNIQPDSNEDPIEYPSSNFNLHKKEVIKYSIESNLSVAIANFNGYTSSGTNFQMPKLKETEWELLQNEVSIISFLQGLNLGGKIYNGYSVVTNDKTEEVVKEERIYISTNDDYYHKINDKHFADDDFDITTAKLGILDLDLEIRKDGATGTSYTQKKGLGCYTSIVSQENVNNKYDSIYEYLTKTNKVNDSIKQIYYTALGRERWGAYKVENSSKLEDIIIAANTPPADTTPPVDEYEITPSDYGGYVTNYTASNGSTVGWRIFYADEENIYLIADDYIEIEKVPNERNNIYVPGYYSRAFSINDGGYEGTSDIDSRISTKWLSKYTYTSTGTNAKKTAYLLDTEMWAGFKDSTYAEYAIGGPTLELFTASYNKTHTEKTIETEVSRSDGYQVKWSDSYYSPSISGLNNIPENLYVISDTTNALGMWVASPSGYYLGYHMMVVYGGSLKQEELGGSSRYGARPIVCLKSNIKARKLDDGTYELYSTSPDDTTPPDDTIPPVDITPPDDTLTAADINAMTEEEIKEIYGAYVTNYTATNATNEQLGIGGWRIFHSDGTNIYLIADDYIVRDYVPAGRNGAVAIPGYRWTRTFGMGNMIYGYNGLADVDSSLLTKWLNKYNPLDEGSIYNYNSRATAYLMDLSAWSGFKHSTYADYAMGGPTLELFAESYNKTHPDKTIEIRTYPFGYAVKWSTDLVNSTSISGLNTSESLYVASNTYAQGMWLASHFATSGTNEVVYVNGAGRLEGLVYDDIYNGGARPIVCLKSNIKLKKLDDGTYELYET